MDIRPRVVISSKESMGLGEKDEGRYSCEMGGTSFDRVPARPYNGPLFVSLFRPGAILCRLHLSNHRTSRKNVSMDFVSG